jgi:hypothetical protein
MLLDAELHTRTDDKISQPIVANTRAYLALIYIKHTAVQYSMLELNNTRRTAFQCKDNKEFDNGCHSHTSTTIKYITCKLILQRVSYL